MTNKNKRLSVFPDKSENNHVILEPIGKSGSFISIFILQHRFIPQLCLDQDCIIL